MIRSTEPFFFSFDLVCVVVAYDFAVCGEVHVPLGDNFVINLIYMDGDIKNNLFVHFEPLGLGYEGSGVV